MIRKLRADEPIPDGQPGRYESSQGYIRLRWRLAKGMYVEELEHRVVACRPLDMDVHHINRVRSDNRRSNLEILTGEQHSALHGALAHLAAVARGTGVAPPEGGRYAEVMMATAASWRQIIEMYESGTGIVEIGAALTLETSSLSRGLRARGVTMRPAKPPFRDVDNDAVEHWVSRGASLAAVARRFGVSRNVVQRIAIGRGLAMPRTGRPTLAQIALEQEMAIALG